MIFEVGFRKDKLVEKIYKQSMEDLDSFFGLNWVKHKPNVFLVKDRKSINNLMKRNTQSWSVGWLRGRDVYVLDKNNFEKESSNKYSEKEYSILIKHELTHVFTDVYLKIRDQSISPDWLWEGLAIYLSGQNEIIERPSHLKSFLDCYEQNVDSTKAYLESGFFVEFLVKKHGKAKLLKLLKSAKETASEKDFAKKFKEIYGFTLDYKNFQ